LDLYEFHIKELCEKYTQKQLAELLDGYIKTNSLLKEDNDNLRSENETLRYLIAKYKAVKFIIDNE
jgi:hypothetical protein